MQSNLYDSKNSLLKLQQIYQNFFSEFYIIRFFYNTIKYLLHFSNTYGRVKIHAAGGKLNVFLIFNSYATAILDDFL